MVHYGFFIVYEKTQLSNQCQLFTSVGGRCKREHFFSIHYKLTALNPFHLSMIQFLCCRGSPQLASIGFTIGYKTKNISGDDNELTEFPECFQSNDTMHFQWFGEWVRGGKFFSGDHGSVKFDS